MSLTLVTGCMFAGKSKFLIDYYQSYIETKEPCKIKGVRYYTGSLNKSHYIKSRAYDKVKLKSLPILTSNTSKLSMRLVEWRNTSDTIVDTILIDEIQFASENDIIHIIEFSKKLYNIVCAGISINWNGVPYDAIESLRKHAIELITLRVPCENCHRIMDKVSVVSKSKLSKKSCNRVFNSRSTKYITKCSKCMMKEGYKIQDTNNRYVYYDKK